MDNGQIPVMPKPVTPNNSGDNLVGGVAASNTIASSGQPAMNSGQAVMNGGQMVGQPAMNVPAQPLAPNGQPMVQQMKPAGSKSRKDASSIIKLIAIIGLSLVSVTFIGLFIWMTVQYNDVNEDVTSRVDAAVAKAKDEQAAKDEAEFLEREKYPYKRFSGPIDYGELSFEYPKTWSVYVAAAATAGGDFNAYFNPVQVDAVGKDTINALRVTIRDKSFEDIVAEYQKQMDKKDSGLTVQAVTVYGTTANRYTGKIPNTDLSGFIVIFKIRDKTVIMQTDSVLFEGDFNKLLETITFNA